jgi:Ethanolamine utilization protein EutJ (predicted chaperonin)
MDISTILAGNMQISFSLIPNKKKNDEKKEENNNKVEPISDIVQISDEAKNLEKNS